MGLHERRFKANLEENVIPYWMRYMQEVVEKQIPIEIDWASFGDRDFRDMQYVETTGVERIALAIREIARADSFGKSAIQESIQKIILKQVDNLGAKSITLADGLLEMHCDWREASHGWFLDSEIKPIVEELI